MTNLDEILKAKGFVQRGEYMSRLIFCDRDTIGELSVAHSDEQIIISFRIDGVSFMTMERRNISRVLDETNFDRLVKEVVNSVYQKIAEHVYKRYERGEGL